MASSSQSPPGSQAPQEYSMHVSERYLNLTKQKLEITRLPRDPRAQQNFDFGVSKSDLEPLIDTWLESYSWRAREKLYNDTLPQFRVPINGTRLHFVHKRSRSPTAIPLLFVHGFPDSFIGVSKIIDALTNPIATPPRGDENVQSFHVIAPSIPGFGFSDPIPEAANNFQATAEVFHSLMKGLGYFQYILHGTGWGFKICRVMALTHPESCIGIHTVNPEVPAPRSPFGYNPDDFPVAMPDPMQMTPGITPPVTPGVSQSAIERPQTTAYALCDSPSGLLAYILDHIRPPSTTSSSPSSSNSPESLRPPTAGRSPRSPVSPQSYATPQQGRSPGSASHSPQNLEMGDITTAWTPTALIDWAMLYWLPGPEVPLRWLANSTPLAGSIWSGHLTIPLGISHFREQAPSFQCPPQWAESYFHIGMIRRRDGRVRFPAWERPAEVVMDIREFTGLITGAGAGAFIVPSATAN